MTSSNSSTNTTPCQYLRVRKLSEYQHYKDRLPPWIKIHQVILEDYEFGRLPDSTKWHAVGLVLLASRLDNKIPADAEWIAGKISSSETVDLEALIEMGFLAEWVGEEGALTQCQWSSRHVSDKLRIRIKSRDGNKCTHCGSKRNIEIDHIVPISKGGTGDEDNLQCLCRTCNRKKRTKGYVAVEQVAPQRNNSAYSEAEAEAEAEAEQRASATSVKDAFDAWVTSLPDGTRRTLTEPRKKALRAAINKVGEPTVTDAVRGWRHEQWGKNIAAKGEVLDLSVILQDRFLENFADAWRKYKSRPQRKRNLGRTIVVD